MFIKRARVELLEHVTTPKKGSLSKTAGLKDFPNAEFEPGFLYVTARAISNRCNANYDAWTADELRKSYRTFIGKPCYVDHANWNPKTTRGVIIDAKLHEGKLENGAEDTWVQLLFEVDAHAFPRLAEKIISGELDAVSMGCNVEQTRCSVCGNTAADEREFCSHIAYSKGKECDVTDQKTGAVVGRKLAFEFCEGSSFFECSFVFDPADESADILDFKMVAKNEPKEANGVESRRLLRHLKKPEEGITEYKARVANISRTARANYDIPAIRIAKAPWKTADTVNMSLPKTVDTLRPETNCPSCGKEFDGLICENCGHEQTPMELDDPNTEPNGITMEVQNQAEQNALNPGEEVVSDPNDAGTDAVPEGQAIDPATGQPIAPVAEDVDTDAEVDPNEPLIDPTTGQPVVDPNAQAPVDPNTGQPVVPNTNNLDPNNQVPQIPESGSPKPPNTDDAGSPDPAPLNKPNPKNPISPNQNIPEKKVNVPTFPEKIPNNTVNKEQDSQKGVGDEKDKNDSKEDSKKKKKSPPWIKQKGGNVSRFKDLVRKADVGAGALDTSGTPFNTVGDPNSSKERGDVPAAEKSVPGSSEVKEAPGDADQEKLDAKEVSAPQGQSEVNVPSDSTVPAEKGAARRLDARRELARRRARAIALQRRADEVRKTDVENLDSNPITEEETRAPDHTADPEAPENQGNQLELADRNKDVNSGPTPNPQKDNPINTVGPYKAKVNVVEALNLVTDREKLGLSSEDNRFAEVARFEAMSAEKFAGYKTAHEEFKRSATKKNARRVRVSREASNMRGADERRIVRLPDMGSQSKMARDFDNPDNDYLLTL